MMRKFITIVIMTVALMTLGGCQNDGHIGWLFGVWRVAEYTVDGTPQDNALIGTTTIAFQNNVVEVVASPMTIIPPMNASARGRKTVPR